MADAWFNNAVNTSPSEGGNWWSDAACTVPLGSIPAFNADNLTVVAGATLDQDLSISNAIGIFTVAATATWNQGSAYNLSFNTSAAAGMAVNGTLNSTSTGSLSFSAAGSFTVGATGTFTKTAGSLLLRGTLSWDIASTITLFGVAVRPGPAAANLRYGSGDVLGVTPTCKVPTAAQTLYGVAVDVSDTGTVQMPNTGSNQATGDATLVAAGAVFGPAGATAGTAALTQQNVRDALKLAPSAGDPATGSIDKHLDDVQTKTDGLNFQGSDVKATLDGEEVTPTTASKTGYALTAAYDAAKTAASASNLALVTAKLPSKAYLAGTANVDGDVELNEATGALTIAALANAPTGSTITYSVSGTSTGAAPQVDITLYQYRAVGPIEITASSSQAGDAHKLMVYSPSAPTTILWSLTTGSGITLGGDNVTITISSDDTNTGSAGTWLYRLINTTDNTVVCEGSLTIEPGPDGQA